MGRRPGIGARGTAGDCWQISTVLVTGTLRQLTPPMIAPPPGRHDRSDLCHDRPERCAVLPRVQTLLKVVFVSDLQLRTASAGVETMNEVAATAIAKLAVQHIETIRCRIAISSNPTGHHFGAFSIPLYGEGGSGIALMSNGW